jgi:DNA gyrase subunit B
VTEVLRGLDGVRKRPGMYIGSVDRDGLHHMAFEVIGNVIDLHLRREATELHVDVEGPWITVRDDGPGFSADALARAFTELHVTPSFDDHFPHVHVTGGLHGVGVAAVNALCARLEVETTRDGVRWARAFERGIPLSEARRVDANIGSGTSVRFCPDPSILTVTEIDHARFRARLQQIAWLNPLLRVFFQGQRLPGLGGVATWVRTLAAERGALAARYATRQAMDNVDVDLAIGWCGADAPVVHTFVNLGETVGGTHVSGLWQGLATWAVELGAPAAGATAKVRDALGPGMIAILHVTMYAPEFGNPSKDQLASPIATTVVKRALANDIPNALSWDKRLRTFLQSRLAAPR